MDGPSKHQWYNFNHTNAKVSQKTVESYSLWCDRSWYLLVYVCFGDEHTNGVNLTIECLERTLVTLQSMGYVFVSPLKVQGDNFTDIKTPTMMTYLADLVRRGIFDDTYISFHEVGHTHADIDQHFAVVANECKRKSKNKAMNDIPMSEKVWNQCYEDEGKRPQIQHVDGVRDYLQFYGPVWKSIGLARLACSQKSSISIGSAGSQTVTWA